jgi:1-acyl-sn-glycerol-3-phosphate acyltransferase
MVSEQQGGAVPVPSGSPEFKPPYPVQFRGSRLARALLAVFGWRVVFDGLPALQGVVVAYPHTSNWDFVVAMLAKWSIGVPVHFWAKDSLFRVPLFGRWVAWLGGAPVQRGAPAGVVGQVVAVMDQHRRDGQFFWLGLAPEGTRKPTPGWRSGFYQTALRAQVPLGLAQLDYGNKQVVVTCFITLSGDEAADMARIAASYQGVRGCVPANAAPVVLLDAAVPRAETVVK